jgi:hypothetical protein
MDRPIVRRTQDAAAKSRWMVVATALLTFALPAVPQAPAPSAGSHALIPSGPGSLAGIWHNTSYKGSDRFPERERVQLTADGKWPPLLPWARDLLEKRIRDSERGHPFANSVSLCLPGGVPEMIFAGGDGFQILEAPGQLIILHQEENHFRLIPLNAAHRNDPDPSYMGDSVGHWDGDTLVVDTVALTTQTTLDQIGMPHSEDLHVIERYRRTAPDTLQILVTIEDPKTFSQPWQAKAVYRLMPAGTRWTEDVCENNRNLPAADGNQGLQLPRH